MKTPNAKTIFAALGAAAAVTAVAAPAVAQPYGYDRQDRYERDARYDRDDRYDRGDRHDRWDNGGLRAIDAREAELVRKMDWGIRRGLITRKEQSELNYSLRQLDRSEAAFRGDGRITPRERAELNRQLDWFEARLEGRLGNGYARR
jgi:hypothetical protein